MKDLPVIKTLEELAAEIGNSRALKKKLTEVDGKFCYRGTVHSPNGDIGVIFINPTVQLFATTGATLFVDGTFRSSILDSIQILNMYRELDGVPRYYGFVLMSSRKKQLYREVFKFLRDELFIRPRRLVSDYEHAMRSAAKDIWPDIKASGCTFHYRQAIRRNYMKKVKGKPHDLRNKAKFKQILLMIYNLQLLPAAMILNGSIIIFAKQVRLNVDRKFRRMNEYIKTYWLQRVTPAGFSMYEVVHRTDNFNEAMNSKMGRFLQRHPNYYHFFNFMCKAMALENQKIATGQPYGQQSRMTANLEEGWDLLRNGGTIQEFLETNFNRR